MVGLCIILPIPNGGSTDLKFFRYLSHLKLNTKDNSNSIVNQKTYFEKNA